MKAGIITIGDELLIGQVIDTNSAWIASELNKLGVAVIEKKSIADIEEHISLSISEYLQKYDIVFITGGLGPTNDDKTKNVLCKIFKSQLVLNNEVLNNILILLSKRNIPINENNKNQAMVPDKAIILQNEIGTAPGLMFTQNNKYLFALPGVPFEMKNIFQNHIVKILKENLNIRPILHKTILTGGLPESVLAEKINKWETNLPDYIKLAYLPSPGYIRLRLSIYDLHENNLATLETMTDELKQIIPDNIIIEEDTTPEKALRKILQQKKLTISTAESCTGGKIASLITSVSGSSAYFKGSIIAYSNEIKTQFLDIPEKILKNYGAVSKEVVEAMALNIKIKFNTDLSIAVSGIAGPDGGTNEKPVGTIWIAVASKNKVYSKKFNFSNDRLINIERTANTAIIMLTKFIEDIELF